MFTYDGSVDTDALERVTFVVDGVTLNKTSTHSALFPLDIADGPAHLSFGIRLSSQGLPCTENGIVPFAGGVDEIAIWEVALTDDQARSVHARGAAGYGLLAE